MKSFSGQKSPIFLSVIKERTPDAAIAVIKNSIVAGAEGFDLHLPALEEQYWNVESLKKIISATDKPILALHYNGDYYNRHLGHTDEQRIELMLMAVKAGAAAIDIQGYTFEKDMATALDGCDLPFAGANPKQVTMRKSTIDKQKEVIDFVHSMGAEVVLSTHVGCMLTSEQALSLAEEIQSRGADVVKIIAKATGQEDIPECLKTVLTLKKHLNKKFTYHLEGKAGKLTRVVAPMLGSYMVFCLERYTESSNFEQCHLKSIVDAFRTLEWNVEE